MKLVDISGEKKEYLKVKIDEMQTTSKVKKKFILISRLQDKKYRYRSIIDFKTGYQHRTNIIKSKKGDLIADCHSILARWRNHFSQLLNVHGFGDVRESDIRVKTAEPSAFGIEMVIEKLKSHNHQVVIKFQ